MPNSLLSLGLVIVLASGCAPSPSSTSSTSLVPPPSILTETTPSPAPARPTTTSAPHPPTAIASGGDEDAPLSQSAQFLIAQTALSNNALPKAAGAFTEALALDQNSPQLLNLAFQAQYFSGNIVAASHLAHRIQTNHQSVALSKEPIAAITAKNQQWEALIPLAQGLKTDPTSAVIGSVFMAWGLAASGQYTAGMLALDDLKHGEATGGAIGEGGGGGGGATGDGGGEGGGEGGLAWLGQKACMAEVMGDQNLATAIANQLLGSIPLATSPTGLLVSTAGVLLRGGETDLASQTILLLGNSFQKARIIQSFHDGTSPLFHSPTALECLAHGIATTQLLDATQLYASLARLHLARFLDPDNHHFTYHIGNTYLQSDATDHGIQVLDEVATNSVWYAPAQLATITALRGKEERVAEAKTRLLRLMRADPDNPILWWEAGLLARASDDNKEALAAFDKAIALGWGGDRIHYMRAVTLAELGQDEEAETAFRHSIATAPFNPHSYNYFGYWILEQGGDLDEALNLIMVAVEHQPDNGAFVDSLGWVLYHIGDFDRAVEFLQHASRLQPNDAVISDHLGDTYFALGRRREAGQEWRRALRLQPDAELASSISEKLDNLNGGG
ncbi:MAG: tetratricopeptide repeat protein [Proteobacteria bacterium]|nr:tetratricopeptide repeat protein [Pseudomonadota bacterium]